MSRSSPRAKGCLLAETFLFRFILVAVLAAAPSPLCAFEWGVFGDVRYRQSTNRENPFRSGFAKGVNLDLYAAHQISEQSDALTEIAFHPDGDNEDVHVERLQIGHTVADWLKVRAGRFHSLLGYWNQAYHHGTYLETSIERPAFLAYEHDGGLLPMHSVGLWLEGSLKSDAIPCGARYDVMVSNSPKIETMPARNDMPTMLFNIDRGVMPMAVLNPQNTGAVHPFEAVAARVELKPRDLPGLLLGFSAQRSRVKGGYDSCPAALNTAPGAPCPTEIDIAQWVFGPHLRLSLGRLELLSEVLRVYDKDNTPPAGGPAKRYRHVMGYVQASFEAVEDLLTPYARYERTNVDSLDPYMTALQGGTQFRWIEGARLNIGSHSALKLELRQVRMHMPEMMNMNGIMVPDHFNYFQQYAFQWAFYF